MHEAANRSTSSEGENPHDLLVFVRSEGSKIRNHHRCQRNRLHLLLHHLSLLLRHLSLLWRNKKQNRRERFLGSWWGRGVRKFNHLCCLIRIRSPLYCWKPPWRILARTNLCGQAVERSKKAGEEIERCIRSYIDQWNGGMKSITEERERERERLEMIRQNTQRENRHGGTSSQGGSVYISIATRLSHITERIHMPTTLANTDTQRVRD